jgi:hypothetical protein
MPAIATVMVAGKPRRIDVTAQVGAGFFVSQDPV